MTDQIPTISHEPMNIVLTIENGKVINSRPVRSDEFTASMETFF